MQLDQERLFEEATKQELNEIKADPTAAKEDIFDLEKAIAEMARERILKFGRAA